MTYAEIKSQRLNAEPPRRPPLQCFERAAGECSPLLYKAVQKHSIKDILAFNRSFILTVLDFPSFPL